MAKRRRTAISSVPLQSGIGTVGYWEPFKRRSLKPHRNTGLEIVYIEHGHLRWKVENSVEVVSPGSLFYTLPWQEHGGLEDIEPGSELYFVIIPLDRLYEHPATSFVFNRHLQIPNRQARHIARILLNSQRHTHPATSASAWLIRQLYREFETKQDGYEGMIRLYTQGLICELARSIRSGKERQPAEHAQNKIRAFLEQLRVRCHEPWTLERMAQACGLGRTHFANYLKRETGDTPVMALNRLRIEKARKLLRETSDSITQIAFSCGFESSQYFARVFKAYTGSAASTYRR